MFVVGKNDDFVISFSFGKDFELEVKNVHSICIIVVENEKIQRQDHLTVPLRPQGTIRPRPQHSVPCIAVDIQSINQSI